MRCSALAEEAISRGLECVFVGTINSSDWLLDRISNLGFTNISEPNDFNPQKNHDVLILDTYDLNIADDFVKRSRWKKIIVIADQQTPAYQADLIIHPGLESEWYNGDQGIFLAGPKYTPFRKSITKNHRVTSRELNRIVIFGGGTDYFGLAAKTAEIIKDLKGFDYATFISNERDLIKSLDPRFSVMEFGFDIDQEISRADLVLTTASTSSFEILARELPLGIACAVENQKSNYEVLGNLGLASQIGERTPNEQWSLNSHNISRLISDYKYRCDLVSKGKNIFDLKGSQRIIDAIILQIEAIQ
jgi:spore coat polysaccharide biosynthesis predicted glycosyltransferase SpsG